MMFKAILAWAGLMASRPPVPRIMHGPSKAAHDAANREQAIFAGAQAVVRRSLHLSDAMAADPGNTVQIKKDVEDMRVLMAEVARRAER